MVSFYLIIFSYIIIAVNPMLTLFQAEIEIQEALASLEMLMSEFFAPATNNFRKREIESMLENFSNRQDSWKHCLLFLQKSQNQYVLMFSLTTLEVIINFLGILLGISAALWPYNK